MLYSTAIDKEVRMLLRADITIEHRQKVQEAVVYAVTYLLPEIHNSVSLVGDNVQKASREVAAGDSTATMRDSSQYHTSR
jgi:hypothetical protein